MEEDQQVFWDILKTKNNNGPFKGGYYVRNDLKDFFQRLKDNNEDIVGIVVDDSYNLEVIVMDQENV